MERQSVASSLVRSVGFDPVASVLEIELTEPRRVYQYHEVPYSAFVELMKAPSKGIYFNEFIRDAYPYEVAMDARMASRAIRHANGARANGLRRFDPTGRSRRGHGDVGARSIASGGSMIDWPSVFAEAMPYRAFLDGYATPSQRARWDAMHGRFRLNDDQKALLTGFSRRMLVLCMAGAWCGDCINQCPVFDHFATATRTIDLRFIDRDIRTDVREALSINGGERVPVVVFLSEDGFEVSRYGERTLSTFRRMAADLLGPACPTGFVPPADEALAAMTADWLAEFERAQLILRLSPRLRAMHGD